MERLVDYVLFLVKSVVKNPLDVTVEIKSSEPEIVLDVIVNKDDMGCVIGKDGHMAGSIRTLVIAYCYLNNLGKIKINFDDMK